MKTRQQIHNLLEHHQSWYDFCLAHSQISFLLVLGVLGEEAEQVDDHFRDHEGNLTFSQLLPLGARERYLSVQGKAEN